MQATLARFKNDLSHSFSVYASVFFVNSKVLGLIFGLLTLLHPNIGLMAFLSMVISIGLLQAFKIPISSATASSTLLNALLTGFLIGDLYVLDGKVLLFLFFCMIFNLLAVSTIETVFRSRQLPVLSVPFSITAVCICLLGPGLGAFADARIYFNSLADFSFLSESLQMFLKSLGSIFCIPDVAFGFLIWISALFYSPLTGIFLIVGYFLGLAVESFFHVSHYESLRYAEGFNYSLVFAAVAGFFMMPSRFSLTMASLAVVMTACMVMVGEAILAPLHLQVMAVPFNLIVLSIILALRNLRPFALNVVFFKNPEESIEKNRLLWQRHRYGEVGLFLPVKGRWLVQQGFSGELTHKGLWQHALDFVAVDSKDQLFQNRGFELEDYFTFSQDVLAPLQGTVVGALGSETDNKIGQVANTKNWGNYLILRGATGVCVTLAHLKKDSLAVKLGDYVQAGQKIAEVGNSGYSQTPHLHVQVQWSAEIGAITTPFHVLNYSCKNQIHFHRTPLKGEVIQSYPHNQMLEQILGFKVDQTMTFGVSRGSGAEESIIQINTKVDEYTGAFYLFDGISRLNFAKVGSQFYFFGLEGPKWSPLWDLFASAPRIPMTYGSIQSFQDTLPAKLTQNALQLVVGSVLQILKGFHEPALGSYQINEQGMEIKGTCQLRGKTAQVFFKMDVNFGILQFTAGGRHYVRKT